MRKQLIDNLLVEYHDTNMPESINNVALSYTIFDISNYDDMEIAHHDGR